MFFSLRSRLVAINLSTYLDAKLISALAVQATDLNYINEHLFILRRKIIAWRIDVFFLPFSDQIFCVQPFLGHELITPLV
jgi:hypothetical protein